MPDNLTTCKSSRPALLLRPESVSGRKVSPPPPQHPPCFEGSDGPHLPPPTRARAAYERGARCRRSRCRSRCLQLQSPWRVPTAAVRTHPHRRDRALGALTAAVPMESPYCSCKLTRPALGAAQVRRDSAPGRAEAGGGGRGGDDTGADGVGRVRRSDRTQRQGGFLAFKTSAFLL